MSNPRYPVSAVAEAPHETVAFGDTCEPELIEGETMEFSPFLLLSPGQVQVLEEHYRDPVVFGNDNLWPTLEVRDTMSFGCMLCDEDLLSTAVSDSEDLLVEVCSSLPLSGQEKRTSPSCSELLDIVTRAVDKLGLERDSEPVKN